MSAPPDATRLYVETSALLRALLEGDVALLALLRAAALRATSALTFVEAERALVRAAGMGRLDAAQQREARRWLREFRDSCDVIVLSAPILERAGKAFDVEPVRTLDALHLASALFWEERLSVIVVASCDGQVRANARALGMDVVPATA